jgi:CHASE3 domain sensor protein
MATIKSKIIINVCIAIFIVIGIVGMNYFNLKEMQQMQDIRGKPAGY